jgi:serine phosphatase RsbU (regulator of sigma subunit)
VVLDPMSGAYDFVSAGHPPAVHLAGDRASFLAPNPMPPIGTGLLPKIIHPSRETLARGQALVFYTDGLIERHDEPINQGVDRLARSLSLPATSAELCAAALDGCVTGRHRNDDICILAVRRKDR